MLKKLILCGSILVAPACFAGEVLESLKPNLINYYSFDNPKDGDVKAEVEVDQGSDKTDIHLLNGAPRVADTPYPGSKYSLETGQRNTGPNDDWKAGVMFKSSAESTLKGSKDAAQITIMGWFKPFGGAEMMPNLNTNTENPTDRYNAIGLGGLLRGDEGAPGLDGHAVRALLEVINDKITAMGRRIDNQRNSGTRASVDRWDVVMPPNQWTHLAATFNFETGAIELYKNGASLSSTPANTTSWAVTPESKRTSDTNAGGIKIGGSYPDNSREFNTFNGRMDELMFFNKALSAEEITAQFKLISPTTLPAK
jgi:hypothetical protein